MMVLLLRAPILVPTLFICFCLALIHASAQDTNILFNRFDGSSNMTLSGIAALDSGLIRLTNVSTRLFGRALYSFPVKMKNPSTNLTSSFSTTFVFCITPMYPTLGGHGMAFLMTPSLDSTSAYPSQYLGLLNSSNNGNASDHLFAVEFDVVQDLEFEDINDNHVGINLNSLTSKFSSSAEYWTSNTTKENLTLKSGQNMQAWIHYDGVKQQLNVSIALVGKPQPSIPLLSVNLDLSSVIEENMYVGFSGSTGVLSGVHSVLAWSFNSNGAAGSLDLSNLPSIVSQSSRPTSKRVVAISTSILAMALLLAVGAAVIIWKRRHREVLEDWELEFALQRYSYRELIAATQGFHEKNLLGMGGFGRVYKGVLKGSGLEVAVKRLSRESDQGQKEFIAEMCSTGRLRHRNLVQLVGWSRHKGELVLIYDYMPNGSLDKMLFGKAGYSLRWEQRYKILKGVAAGMFYLHEGWEQQVLHRDVKASNVLLDADMNGKLSDFGLARLYEHGKNAHTTRVVGTLGYLAPEFSRTGKATTSTDVFSYGALLLEVATGRRPIEHKISGEQFILVEGVMDLYTNEKLLDAADPKLGDRFDVEEMEKVLVLGLLCSHPNPSARPTMRQVVQMLAGDTPVPPLPPYQTSFQSKTVSEAASFSSCSWSTPDNSTNISAR